MQTKKTFARGNKVSFYFGRSTTPYKGTVLSKENDGYFLVKYTGKYTQETHTKRVSPNNMRHIRA